jgi:mono/diheme cytochrome c family protein
MSSHWKWFVLGIVTTLVVLAGGAYLFVKAGGISMETTAAPLPLEKTVAGMALRASLGHAADQKDPLPFNDDTMLAAARIFKQECAVCHGIPGYPPTLISKGMFPDPPQLFEKQDMVAGDPEGETFWKVTHGIRLSGMPGFGSTLSDTERWQLTMLVAHADKLSPAVQAELSH